MTQPYTFAKFLPEHLRRKAATRNYAKSSSVRRCEHGYCPLGLILHDMGLLHYADPPASTITRALIDAGIITRDNRKSVQESMHNFIRAWDLGKIPHDKLAVALDVHSEETHGNDHE